MAKTPKTSVTEQKVKAEKTKAPKAEKVVADPLAALAGSNTTAEKVVIDRAKHNYTVHKDAKTASGRSSIDCGDPLAEALRGKTAAEVVDLVAANGGEPNPNWENLNQGMARMSAGNVLRRLAKRTEGITIDGKVIKLEATPTKAVANLSQAAA